LKFSIRKCILSSNAINGYDFNPYTFYSSPFGRYKLPYGIEIFVTDLAKEGEDWK